MILKGRGISKGVGQGKVVLSPDPTSFLGGVDPGTGKLIEQTSAGRSITGQVFAFPRGKGSTVGSYVLLEMKRMGTLPVALINTLAEPIVATGAVMSGVPLVDRIDLSLLRDGDHATVNGTEGTVDLPHVREAHVVSCVVRDGDRVLLLKRSGQVGTFKGYWAAVSGFVEEGETPDLTAMKELGEETGLSLPIIKEGKVVLVRDQDQIWCIHPFLFEAHKPQVEIDWEHTEYRWVRPDEVVGFQTVPGLMNLFRDLL